MWDTETLKLFVPAIVAILGWFAAHQFNVYRDRANKRRDLRVQYLLEAYRRLEFAANRPEAGKEEQDKFESALADIQLLGTEQQIEELMKFLAEFNSSVASINPLLELLRSHLRRELKLEKNIPGIKIFRFENRHPDTKQNMPKAARKSGQ
ncbi:MAG: hypothetical protein WA435_03510 [Gallionellaceae bacterium]